MHRIPKLRVEFQAFLLMRNRPSNKGVRLRNPLVRFCHMCSNKAIFLFSCTCVMQRGMQACMRTCRHTGMDVHAGVDVEGCVWRLEQEQCQDKLSDDTLRTPHAYLLVICLGWMDLVAISPIKLNWKNTDMFFVVIVTSKDIFGK